MEFKVKDGEKTHKIKVEYKNETFFVSLSDEAFPVKVENITSNSFLLKEENKILRVYYVVDNSKLHVFIKGRVYTFEKEARKKIEIAHEEKGDRIITSPLPGTITKIHVKEGEEVEKNQPLIVIESMKMENVIVSPLKGIVSKINVSVGELTEGNKAMMEIKAL
ncbi:MAG: biotin/lipoyl-containing protein [Candidatus Aminicenantia bacterium]